MTIHSSTSAATTRLAQRFDGHSAEYLQWRNQRLHYQAGWRIADAIELSPGLNTATDQHALAALCSRTETDGFACYQWTKPCTDAQHAVARLHTALSLTSHDQGVVNDDHGLSLLTDLSGTPRGRFIPYTSRAMGWHSDGYYNAPTASLRSFAMHCIQPAASGGALSLLDDRLMLIALYDDDPQLVALLSHPEAMRIPANKDNLGHDRPDRYSAVFFNHADGTTGTHFTTRTKNISWRTADTLAAAERMAQLIEHHSHWQYSIRLQPGQGIVTRNILHRRDAFTDDPSQPPRQMLRGRYLQLPQPPAQHAIKQAIKQESANATRQ